MGAPLQLVNRSVRQKHTFSMVSGIAIMLEALCSSPASKPQTAVLARAVEEVPQDRAHLRLPLAEIGCTLPHVVTPCLRVHNWGAPDTGIEVAKSGQKLWPERVSCEIDAHSCRGAQEVLKARVRPAEVGYRATDHVWKSSLQFCQGSLFDGTSSAEKSQGKLHSSVFGVDLGMLLFVTYLHSPFQDAVAEGAWFSAETFEDLLPERYRLQGHRELRKVDR